MPPLPSRAQIAQRMRQELMREIDHEIVIDRLLSDARYARDVLLVCDALATGDLAALARLYREAEATELARQTAPAKAADADTAAPPGHAPQANDWGRDTSGFGITEPPPLAADRPASGDRPDGDGAPAERRRSWIKPWRRN